MNKPVSAKCCSRILSDLRQFSIKMRRSRKLSCKKGGVDCRVSRRERDISNTFSPTTCSLPALQSPLEPNKLSIQDPKRKKDLMPFLQNTLGILIHPHPSLFFSSQNPNISTNPLLIERPPKARFHTAYLHLKRYTQPDPIESIDPLLNRRSRCLLDPVSQDGSDFSERVPQHPPLLSLSRDNLDTCSRFLGQIKHIIDHVHLL